MSCEHLLIDTRNALYRAIYAGLSDKSFGQDPTVILFRFFHSYVIKFRPKQIHLFWDAPKETLWRRKIYPSYKDGRGRDADIEKLMERSSNHLRAVAPCLAMRSYFIEKQEADDLIYAFCRMHCRQHVVIVSSDGDFKQIIHQYPSVVLYNPLSKEGQAYVPDGVDPVTIKCFSGESGDNISGYHLVGPVKARQLAENPQRRLEFFKDHDASVYARNRALIDLSVCPYLLQNMLYVDEVLGLPVKYDYNQLQKIVLERKIRGLAGELNQLVGPYASLV